MKALVATLCVVVVVVLCLEINGQDCSGKPNTWPISTDVTFVAETKNGKLYKVAGVSPPVFVLHLWGTPYEMGYAHGSLLKQQITEIVPEVEQYIESQVDASLAFLPAWLREFIEKEGYIAALDLTYYLTEAYTPTYFYDEIRGMAEGAGLDYDKALRVHMFPELIKAQCSMFGAWGPAITQASGPLLQLRALDWETHGPFQKYPVVIVYHPSADNGHPYSVVSWSGFIGAITGYSSAPLALSQKVWINYNESSTRAGIPFHFLLRDILQFDNTIDDGINRIINAQRTCSIFVGLGDPVNKFRAIEYAYEEVNVFDDFNYPLYQNHPRFAGLVYIDKHPQPSTHACLASLLQKYYGQLDALTTIQHISAELQTGDMHIAVYDFAKQYMYVANASPVVNGTVIPAYDRPFLRLDMVQQFAVLPPN